jgi:TolB protein
VNANGTNNTQITSDNPYYYNTSAVFRSDSKIWYFNNQSMVSGELNEINYDGTGKTRISNFNADLAKCISFSINKSGTRICYYKQKLLDPGKIYIANIDFTNERRLTTGTSEEKYPQFSPDGQKIVYSKTTGDISNVHVINSDGTGDRPLTGYTNSATRIDSPRWSPDGSKIAYSFFDGTQWDIWMMNSDGTDKHNVTNTSNLNEAVTDWK